MVGLAVVALHLHQQLLCGGERVGTVCVIVF